MHSPNSERSIRRENFEKLKKKTFYYWNEEIGKLVKEKYRNIWNGLVQKTHSTG